MVIVLIVKCIELFLFWCIVIEKDILGLMVLFVCWNWMWDCSVFGKICRIGLICCWLLNKRKVSFGFVFNVFCIVGIVIWGLKFLFIIFNVRVRWFKLNF